MKTAIFDFDGTLFDEETIPFCLNKWKTFGYSSRQFYKVYSKLLIVFLQCKLKLGAYKEKIKMRNKATELFLELFEGLSEDETMGYFNRLIPEIEKHFNLEVVQAMKAHKADGYRVIMLSGCFDVILSKIAKILPIDDIICTSLIIDKDGLNAKQRIDIVSAEAKLKHLMNYAEKTPVNFEESYSYADSYYDYEILKICGHPVAVKPDDKLRKIAVQEGFSIME